MTETKPTRLQPARGDAADETARRLPRWAAQSLSLPVTAVLALYLLATSRWGSYVSPPGSVIYVADVAIAVAVAQVAVALLLRRSRFSELALAPLTVLLSSALLAYAGLRFAARADVSLMALRDLAPYAYSVVAVLTFLLPVGRRGAWRLFAYLVLAFHLMWSVGLPRLAGYPWTLPVLGTDAQVFSARPDFDATVLGATAALAVYEVLSRARTQRRSITVTLVALALTSIAGLLSLSTRAGLLAGILMLGVAVVAAIPSSWVKHLWGAHRAATVSAAALLLTVGIAGVGLSPAGSRLAESFSGGAASGTISARQTVWSKITDYILSDPERTAVGVGFGRDFIAESGTTAALEGGVYTNVRSPHNYLLGTGARLGAAGVMVAGLLLLLGWWMAVAELGRRPDTVTALAAFVVLGIPVVALLGVVLESPFGAIPYFWGIGQLAAARLRRPDQKSGAAVS